jgi:hypothetical protein
MNFRSQHFGGKMGIGILGWGLGQMTSESIIHINLHKPNNKLICIIETLLVHK